MFLRNLNSYDVVVVSGSNQRMFERESHEVSHFIKHHNFDQKTLENDIGLIKVDKRKTSMPIDYFLLFNYSFEIH